MKNSLLSLCFLFSSFFSQAQTAEDSIKTVVNNLFDAVRNADIALLNSCFADSAILQTIVSSDKITEVKTEAVSEFASFVAASPKNDIDERITFDAVKTDGILAIVWAPYKFYYKGKFTHCGTDSFQLVRINGKWKIQYLIDTRRKTGCD